ncbi:MAG: SMR family transporter [Polyangiaceae bacterium]
MQNSLPLLMTVVVILNTIAQALLKMAAGRGLINAPMIGGVAAYGLSTLLYVIVLKQANLSFAYPVIIGATMIVTCFVGVIVLNERLAVLQWLGIALIIAGIGLVAAMAKKA